ncbi:MAG: hypothetical protein CMH54_10975 [Myxococcales bacterium]|nr:hypothetical protein [Myxococcales bacterium]|tara:strand:- start:409 stop:2505 length:2097 start_codon:yes stop_codon:yes gene_type:complete
MKQFAWSWLCLLLLFAPEIAKSQVYEDIEVTVAKARKQPPAKRRSSTNIKTGIRGVTFSAFAISPADPNRMFLSSWDGFAYSSDDRGLTWGEGRLVVKRRKFFGSIRPSPIGSGAPFSMGSTLQAMQRQGFLSYKLSNTFAFPYGTTGEAYLEFTPDSPAFWPGISPPGLNNAGDMRLWDQRGASLGGDDMARLGVGFKTGSAWLARVLKKKKKKIIQMNLQLVLNLKGVEPTGIEFVAANPVNPNEAFLASQMGLWRTKDGGLSWFLVFPGTNQLERHSHMVTYHPTEPNMVFLATGQGLRISNDGGETFQPIRGTQLSTARTLWISFAPGRPETIYAGTTIGLFRSDDNGKTWRWIYFSTLDSQNRVTGITADAVDPDKITISTWDGIFQTDDGGKNWRRSGGLLFTGVPILRFAGDPHDSDHMVCLTWRQVWETYDRGKTWSIVYLNDSEWSPRHLVFDPHDTSVVWVLTSAELIRLTPYREKNFPDIGFQKYQERVRVEPNLSETIDASLRAYGVHRGERSAQRTLARYDQLLPIANLAFGYMYMDANALLYAVYRDINVGHKDYYETRGGLPAGVSATGNAAFDRYNSIHNGYIYLSLRWRLPQLIFNHEEAPFGRVFNDANYAYRYLKGEISRLFEERRRVLLRFLTEPPKTQRGRILLSLRLQELTAHLNAHSNGQWDEAVQWVEQQIMDY